MVTMKYQTIRKETRIGEVVTIKRGKIRGNSDITLLDYSQGSVVSFTYVSIGSAFGAIFLDEKVTLSLPDSLNYQTYSLSDTLFQSHYALLLNYISEDWFSSFTSKGKKEDVVDLCKLLSNELFHLLEQSSMEQYKSSIPFKFTSKFTIIPTRFRGVWCLGAMVSLICLLPQ